MADLSDNTNWDAQDVLNWLNTTCEDEDDHTCEWCFQGRDPKGCELKLAAHLIQAKMQESS